MVPALEILCASVMEDAGGVGEGSTRTPLRCGEVGHANHSLIDSASSLATQNRSRDQVTRVDILCIVTPDWILIRSEFSSLECFAALAGGPVVELRHGERTGYLGG